MRYTYDDKLYKIHHHKAIENNIPYEPIVPVTDEIIIEMGPTVPIIKEIMIEMEPTVPIIKEIMIEMEPTVPVTNEVIIDQVQNKPSSVLFPEFGDQADLFLIVARDANNLLGDAEQYDQFCRVENIIMPANE
jgi:hypothetical protein